MKKIFSNLPVVLLILAVSPVWADGVLISEFMAANQTLLMDGDGDSSDWVELYKRHDLTSTKPSYEELQQTFGLTRNQVRNTLHRVRNEVRRAVEDLVSEYVHDSAEAAGEFKFVTRRGRTE